MTLVHALPPESATATVLREGAPAWELTDHLLDDIRRMWASTSDKVAEPYPGRPLKDDGDVELVRIERFKAREEARRERLAAREAATDEGAEEAVES